MGASAQGLRLALRCASAQTPSAGAIQDSEQPTGEAHQLTNEHKLHIVVEERAIAAGFLGILFGRQVRTGTASSLQPAPPRRGLKRTQLGEQGDRPLTRHWHHRISGRPTAPSTRSTARASVSVSTRTRWHARWIRNLDNQAYPSWFECVVRSSLRQCPSSWRHRICGAWRR